MTQEERIRKLQEINAKRAALQKERDELFEQKLAILRDIDSCTHKNLDGTSAQGSGIYESWCSYCDLD